MNPSHFFFFNDTATTEIYTLSLHDALPISRRATAERASDARHRGRAQRAAVSDPPEALDARPQDALRRLLRYRPAQLCGHLYSGGTRVRCVRADRRGEQQ